MPTVAVCLQLLRHRDAEKSEEGFHWLLPRAKQHMSDLAAALQSETHEGAACWLCELLASTRMDEAVQALAPRLNDPRQRVRESARVWLSWMDTRAARTAIYDFDRGSPP